MPFSQLPARHSAAIREAGRIQERLGGRGPARSRNGDCRGMHCQQEGTVEGWHQGEGRYWSRCGNKGSASAFMAARAIWLRTRKWGRERISPRVILRKADLIRSRPDFPPGGSWSRGFREPRATPACDRDVEQFRNRRAISSKGTLFASGTIVSTPTSYSTIIPQKKANTAIGGQRLSPVFSVVKPYCEHHLRDTILARL